MSSGTVTVSRWQGAHGTCLGAHPLRTAPQDDGAEGMLHPGADEDLQGSNRPEDKPQKLSSPEHEHEPIVPDLRPRNRI